MSAADELEVKARVPDAAALGARLRAAGAALEFEGELADVRLDREGELARRDEVVRVRVWRPAAGAPRGVVGWKGPASVRGVVRHRAEIEFTAGDADRALALFARLGYRPTLRIDRRVTVFRLGDATLRLEVYPEMDTLVEVEGSPDGIERAIAATGLPRDAFLPESLPHFVAEYERRTGKRARIAREAP